MWGKTGRGTSTANPNSTASASSSAAGGVGGDRPPRDPAEAAAAGMSGFGYGGAPPESGRRDDVPHFDFERHRMQQERRRRRAAGSQGPQFEFAPGGVWLPAAGVVTLLFLAVGLTSRTSEPVRLGTTAGTVTGSGKTKSQSS